jgi:hypothetical protein
MRETAQPLVRRTFHQAAVSSRSGKLFRSGKIDMSMLDARIDSKGAAQVQSGDVRGDDMISARIAGTKAPPRPAERHSPQERAWGAIGELVKVNHGLDRRGDH